MESCLKESNCVAGTVALLANHKEQDVKKGLRQLDERRLNNLLDVVPGDVVERLLTKKALPSPEVERERSNKGGGGHRYDFLSKNIHSMRQNDLDNGKSAQLVKKRYVNIPLTVSRIITASSLMDESDSAVRIKIFIGYCRLKNYSFFTVKRYLKIAQRHGVFGEDLAESGSCLPVYPDPTVFKGRIHVRVVSPESYSKLFLYLSKNLSPFFAPILIPFYTALRTHEVLQFDSSVLKQLRERRNTVSVKLKQTSLKRENIYWKPTYTSFLVKFIDRLIVLYDEEFQIHQKTGRSDLLFHVTPKTLNNRLRLAYSLANPNLKAPLGFGIHTCRNMTASLMAEATNNLPSVQAILQHKSLKTTARYVKTDYKYMTEQFNRITADAFFPLFQEKLGE